MPEKVYEEVLPAESLETPHVSWLSIAIRTRRSRNAGSTPRPALRTISPSRNAADKA
jgi:hypothetical protein